MFQDKYTFKKQKQTTFKANMTENMIKCVCVCKKKNLITFSILIKTNMHWVKKYKNCKYKNIIRSGWTAKPSQIQ